MQYIIFGAGETGAKAIGLLGLVRVKCFVDNDSNKKQFHEKEVKSFDELRQMDLTDIIIVIASEKYWAYIERQLLSISVVKYFVFRETDPLIWNQIMPNYVLNKQYETVSYNRILAFREVEKYKKIAILGTNLLLPYLVSEIAMQNDFKNIIEIISDADFEAEHCMGIPIVTWEEADKNFDCLIVNVKRNYAGLDKILEKLPDEAAVIDIYDVDCVEPLFYHPELKKYKNIHEGKRIFVIGNGSSLRLEDLEKLHDNGEICFGCNKIYKAYDQIKWRPDFLVIEDTNGIENYKEILGSMDSEKLFLGDSFQWEILTDKIPEKQYFHIREFEIKKFPKFSRDITEGCYEAGTVIYLCLQIAVYMGAKEIYLLGVDCDYADNPFSKENHFIKDYYSESEEKKFRKRGRNVEMRILVERMFRGFEMAEKHSRKYGFRIYNATRGGKLEAFERVNFDSLF